MKRLKRYDLKKLREERPEVWRELHCRSVVALMALEGVDVEISGVYEYYDEVIMKQRSRPPESPTPQSE